MCFYGSVGKFQIHEHILPVLICRAAHQRCWLCLVVQIMYQVFSGQKPPLKREGMPKDYEQLIEDCWNDSPDERPTFANILLRLRQMYAQERQRLFALSQGNGSAASQ